MPLTNPPRVPFGPKTYSARDTFAKKLNQVRRQYVGGANRRNMAAIRSGIKARTAAAGMAPKAIVPSGTLGVPAPTEGLIHSLTALNEALLDLSNLSDAAARDPEYRALAIKAFEAKDPKKKMKYHRKAAERATACTCDERAGRHIRIAAAQGELVAA